MTAYRYAGATSAGSANGLDWDNRWLYTSIPWATITSLASTQPVYVFLDGGSISLTYNSALDISGDGSSDTNRIYIMPGYAADQMGVSGDHSGHTGQVIFDLVGADDTAISIEGSYVTVDGYSDPRLSAGNDIHFTVRGVDGSTAKLVGVWAETYITIRNLNLYQTSSAYEGDAIHLGHGQPSVDCHILVELCYIHDGGTAGVEFAGVWVNGCDNTIIRYCEIRNWGTSNGEGVGFSAGNQTGGFVHNNLFLNVGVAVRSVAYVRFNTIIDSYIGIATYNLGEDAYYENNFLYEWSAASINVAGTDDVYINANLFYDAEQSCDATIHGSWIDTVADLNSIEDELIHIEDDNLVATSGYLVDPGVDGQLSSSATKAVDGAYTSNWSRTQDFLGESQVGTAWDIGAYEFLGGYAFSCVI